MTLKRKIEINKRRGEDWDVQRRQREMIKMIRQGERL